VERAGVRVPDETGNTIGTMGSGSTESPQSLRESPPDRRHGNRVAGTIAHACAGAIHGRYMGHEGVACNGRLSFQNFTTGARHRRLGRTCHRLAGKPLKTMRNLFTSL